jgi:hypothetical protein
MNVFLVKLPIAEWIAYQDGTLNPIVKDGYDKIITRFKLIGKEAMIVPECSVEVIEFEPPTSDEDQREFAWFKLNVGQMPPSRAKAYLETTKSAFADHPLMKHSIWTTHNNDGHGTNIEILKL